MSAPSTLAEQIAAAQAEVATWPPGMLERFLGRAPAQTDIAEKINALRVRGINYEPGVADRHLVDRAEVLALLKGAA